MPFGEGYRPKSPEELSHQVDSAQGTLGPDADHSLVPQSQDKEKILQMSESELKQKFVRRYEMYLQLLRDQKRQEKTGESNLSAEDIEDMKKWLGILNSLDKYIKKHHEGKDVTLRGKQIDVFDSMRNFLEEGGTEGYVKLPTGVGKTVLFTELIEAMDVKTLIVVPTKILVDQTGEKLEEFAPDLEFGKVYAYAKEHGRQITVITYSSLVSQIETGQINPEDFECLILDEAHVSLSDKRQEAVGKFDNAIKLGFTATPKFSEKKQVSNLLEKEIHSMTIREAVESGMLCSVSSIIIRTEADISKVKTKDGEYNEKELEKAVNIVSRNKAAVDLYKKVYNGKLAVAYCVGINHAADVAKEFNEAGVSAAYISGKTPKKEQEEILERFHKGVIKVLCNADLLVAGFDEEKASVCLNLRPTQSRIDAEQRGGRVLRLDKTKPKKLATVVDFLDKNYSIDKPPVLFADVAEGANFYSGRDDERSGGGGRGGDGGEVPIIIDIEGIEVIYDYEEVLKIVRKIIEDRERGNRKTIQQIVLDLEGAFNKWFGFPPAGRGKFNKQWLIHNGFDHIIDWCKGNGISFVELIDKVEDEELKRSFEFQEQSEDYSLESALVVLESAFNLWLKLPENNRGDFNLKWIIGNVGSGVYQFAKRKLGSFKLLVDKSENESLKENFKYIESHYDEETEKMLLVLEEAYIQWLSMPVGSRGSFNKTWLVQNNFNGLRNWAIKKFGDFNKFVKKSRNPKIRENFDKGQPESGRNYVKRTKESAFKELNQAYRQWKKQSANKRGNFGYVWLRYNGYHNLTIWASKTFGLFQNFIDQSTNEELKWHVKNKK